MEFSLPLSVFQTNIPGLLVLNLPVHGDNRGWFKENWQRSKMVEAGLPDFQPVQNNISFNGVRGTTRGIHAEPWDKLVSVASGKVFAAWVDLRKGESFGQVFTLEIDPSVSVYVPRGVGNSYQTLEDASSYSYLVNDHWSPEGTYTFLNLADPTVNIQWPIPLDAAERSAKDLAHPFLEDLVPVEEKKIVILGGNGQLGQALRIEFAGAISYTRAELDISNSASIDALDWSNISTIINASAYTQVDAAETSDGRALAWNVNAVAVAYLAQKCQEHNVILVHYSSDYVFDGEFAGEAKENQTFAPLGVYGQTKAAADIAVSTIGSHYLLRTSWVIGEGKNFVETMANLAIGDLPSIQVVDDQLGRLSFAEDVARATKHLIEVKAPFGTYNATSSGPLTTWFEIATRVFEMLERDAARLSPVSTEEYFGKKIESGILVAPRPKNSMLNLEKLTRTGFISPNWESKLDEYLANFKK